MGWGRLTHPARIFKRQCQLPLEPRLMTVLWTELLHPRVLSPGGGGAGACTNSLDILPEVLAGGFHRSPLVALHGSPG